MKRIISILFLIALCIVLDVSSVLAVTMDNGGGIKKVPYGDSKLAQSLSGAEYVDCYIPYKKTPKDIGGYSIGAREAGNRVTSSAGTPMSESVKNAPVATTVMEEVSYAYASNHRWNNYRYANPTGLDVNRESSTQLDIIKDKNGNEYYMTAVQPFFFNHNKAGKNGFPANCSGGYGEIIDVILTNGMCIHFVCFDINASGHTNGYKVGNDGDFDYVYTNCKLNYKQYNNLFSTQNGNTLELWGDTSRVGVISQAFKKKYNLGSGSGQNRIAYYRMYNKYIKESPKRNKGVGKGVDFSYGNVTIVNSPDESGADSTDNASNSDSESVIVKEQDLIGMPEVSKLMDGQEKITLSSRSDLDIGEQYSLGLVGNDIYTSTHVSMLNTARVLVTFVGLILVFYSVLLILGYIFDKTNRFFDFNLTAVLTLGAVTYTDDEDAKHLHGYASFGKLIFIAIVILCVGMLLISGGVFSFMSEVLYKIISIF